MKLNENFIIREMAGITALLSLDGEFHGIMAVNGVGARILQLLQDGILEEKEIVIRLCEEYNAPESEISEDVRSFLGELRENGILKDE